MALLLIAVEVPDVGHPARSMAVAEELVETQGCYAGAQIIGAGWMPEGNTAGTPERLKKALEGSEAWGKLAHSVDYLTALGLLVKVTAPGG